MVHYTVSLVKRNSSPKTLATRVGKGFTMYQSEPLRKIQADYVVKGSSSRESCYIASARGAVLVDVDGKEYIDFAGGIGVMNIGHCHPKVVAAVQDQAAKLMHSCFMVLPYEPGIKLAKKLCEITPGNFPKSAAFFNSGAEAVENAVKVARYHTKRPAVIVFENAYHGRTLLTMTMTSKIKPYKYGFGPFAPEVYRMPFGDKVKADYLNEFFAKYVAADSVAAVVAEPVQGEGGFIVPSDDYFPKLISICHDNGILFIADEIQSGMGRTGKMFAMEHWGVEPDITLVAKSLAAGMPLSAIVGKKEIMDGVHDYGIGGTYSGNPLACRAALAVLEVFEEEDMLAKSRALGEKLKARFEKWVAQYEIVGCVRGLGAMLGIELVEGPNRGPAPEKTKALIAYCRSQGLIIIPCGTYGNVIRVLAPFVITDEQLNKGLNIMEGGLQAIS